MNKRRRTQLTEANALLDRALDIVESVREEEQDAMDNCPENLQYSERYSMMEDAVGELEDAISSIQEAAEHIGRAREGG